MKYLSIDSQILSSFSACQRRAKFGFVERLVPKDPNPFFDMGKVAHVAHEEYYKALREMVPFEKRVQLALLTANTYAVTETDMNSEQISNVVQALNKYYNYRKDDRIFVKSVEEPFSKIIYVGPDLNGEDITIAYEGLIDLIGADDTATWNYDHKTTSKWQLKDPVDLRLQFMGYRWATGNNVVHNRLSFNPKHAPSEAFKRFYFKYDDRAIADWKSFAIDKALEYSYCLEAGIWKPNFRACEGEHGYACQFATICRYPSLATETKELEYRIGEPWDIFKEKNT